jgi:hypothetical protein
MSSVKRSFAQSAAFLERSRRSLAGGVSSPFRACAPIPLFVQDARGSRFTDVDGNESSTMRGPVEPAYRCRTASAFRGERASHKMLSNNRMQPMPFTRNV